MPHFDQGALEVVLYSVAAIALILAGYKLGRLIGSSSAGRTIAERERELFTAQKGFKNLYEQELAHVRAENEQLKQHVQQLGVKIEEYRKKAAGLGGLFNSGGKKADAMYALLLENEALEEALYAQNDKLRQERTDAVKEQLRAASYRRVLMSQLMEEGKLRGTADQVLNAESQARTDRQLPDHSDGTNGTSEHR